MVWIAKVVVFQRLRSGRGGEKREVAFAKYLDMKVPLDAVGNDPA